MRTIRHVILEDDDYEGMFDEAGNLLGAWHANDGNWRGEYFDGFLKELGITVKYSDNRVLKSKLRRNFR